MRHIRRSRPDRGRTGGLSARSPVLRLVSLSLVVCLVPLALLTYLTIHLANRAVVDEVNARVRTTSAVTAVLFSTQIESVAAFTNSYARRQRLIIALADGDPANFDEDVVEAQLAELAPPGSGGAFLATTGCTVTQVRPFTPEVIGVDFSSRDWCRGVTSTGVPYVSEAYRSAIAGHPLAVAVAVPVRAIGAARPAPFWPSWRWCTHWTPSPPSPTD